ncbi:LADA_0D03576g1_1 [Lachancea dasiensis]|uniref:LADA_0D03576g1_1 n=1 Tax=Lachancea dasiensis TaxID=1072105 RepID=A0A1G4J5A6_9SACH|nr:LADA_0D03576g1_1 [Lachancea dasiensis]
MNANQQILQDPLGSIVMPQFQSMSLSGTSTPLLDSGSIPLQKSGSLLNNIGIQRAHSPFVNGNGAIGDPMYVGQQPAQQTPHQASVGLRDTPSSSSATINWSQRAPGNSSLFGLSSGDSFTPIGSSNQQQSSSAPPLPPGVFSAQPQLVVVESQWKYVDFQGMIQGPFPSQSMTNWYQAGYLQASLQIMRVASTPEPFGVNDTFGSLGDLMATVGDFTDPFSKFDIIVTQTQAQTPLQHPGSTLPPVADEQSNVFESLSGVLVDSKVPFADHAITVDGSSNACHAPNVESQDYTHGQLLQLRDDDGGFYQETISQIPIDKFVESDAAVLKSLDTSSFKTRLVDQDAVQRRREFELASKQRKDQEKAQKQEALLQQHIAESAAAMELQKRRQQEAEIMAKQKQQHLEAEGIAKQRQRQLHEDNERRKQANELARNMLLEEEARLAREQQEVEDLNKREEVEKLRKESSTPSGSSQSLLSAKPAPWANKTKSAIAVPSLADVQQKEAAQRAKRKQAQEQQTRELAAKLQQQVLNEESQRPRIDSIATWASKKDLSPALDGPKAPVKTIEQIQKDQLEQKKFLEEQKKLWEEAQKSAKVSPPNLNSGGNEWTTVTKKQPALTKTGSAKHLNQSQTFLSPEKLRSMSATSSKQIGSSTSIPTLKAKAMSRTPSAYTGNASTSLRQEFLKWCKSQMKLSPEVDANGVLEVLFSLPAGPESKEIIADTIYSNSVSMDGRRFAGEFIKRRVECESKLTDSLTWSEALTMPKGDVDDWEFQVVGKKKNRKH